MGGFHKTTEWCGIRNPVEMVDDIRKTLGTTWIAIARDKRKQNGLELSYTETDTAFVR